MVSSKVLTNTKSHTSTQSLAQELIDDLDGLSDEELPEGSGEASATDEVSNENGKRPASTLLEDDHEQEDQKMDEDDEPKDPNQVQLQEGQLYIPTGGVRPADELDAEAVESYKLGKVMDVRKVAPLTSSKRMKDVLEVSEQ